MLRLVLRGPRSMLRAFADSAFLKQTSQLLSERAKAQVKIELDAGPQLRKANVDYVPKEGVYKHPYCTTDFPLILNRELTFRTVCELVGPEQVSPHFQSVEEYGKWYTYFLTALIFCVSMRSHNNHAFGYCVLNMFFGMEVWIYCFGMYFARSTVLITPNPWKLMWIKYDMDAMLTNLYENEETRAEEKRKAPIGQIDYLRLHQEYLGTKAVMIDTYLKTQRIKLKQHTYERALSVLRNTEKMEQENVNKVLRELMQKANALLFEQVQSKTSSIQVSAFQSALEGIRAGKMQYKGDPLLPIIQDYIEKFREELENAAEGDLSSTVGLTEDQKTQLKTNDERLEQQFLTALPQIKHPKILGHPLFQNN